MSINSHNIYLISDFNAKPLAQYLKALSEVDGLIVNVAPFGQVYQSLSFPSCESGGLGIVWTLPERVIPSFARAMNLEEVDHEICIRETRHFAKAIQEFAERRQYVFVVSWSLPPGFRGYGVLDWVCGIGLSNLIAKMNICLSEILTESRNVYVLDVVRWFDGIQRVLSPKMWYAAKVPFANTVFEKAARDCLSAIRAVSGQSRKLIVIDLDNTIWGGVIGETGWQGIRLGGLDHVGEAFKNFQETLLALSNRGVQLAVVSKNDELVALEAFDYHSEMLIKRENLAGWRINWSDKAANIVSLAEELNLGLGAVVFIDDNPAERDRVRAALPDVLVPEWPEDPTNYVSAIRALNCFDVSTITTEDRKRTAMYVAERERRETRFGSDSLDLWLEQLGTVLNIMTVNELNISRVVQLFNKTNQLNLSTRRLSEEEVMHWTRISGHVMLAVSASDKFGDLGLVGVLSVVVNGEKGTLVDFILSCRVMGRKVENAMLHMAACEVKKLGGKLLEATYSPTPRNRPTLDVFRASGMLERDDGIFIAETLSILALPEQVSIAQCIGR